MMADRLGDMLRSRYYRPVMFGLLFILLLGLWVAVLNRNGDWPPAFLQPRPSIAITGPGVGSNAQIQAYVLGAVHTPGVYTLPQGSRVHDLITSAGGALTTADLSRVNLAAVLADGQSIYVPLTGEDIPFERGGKVDINVATAQQMHNALGISLTTARHIVAYRAAHGDFTAVSQLLLVPITRDIYDRIKDLVTV